MDLSLLREETREQHEATEAILPLNDPALDRDSYGHILQCFGSVVEGWETWATNHVPPALAALVSERRRLGLLLRDLRFLGLSPLAAPAAADLRALESLLADKQPGSAAYEAVFLGAMYVMEGSTLGGQYIARHVEARLGLVSGQGDAYFRGHGEKTGSMWNAFREVLSAVPDEHTPLVIAAARAAFAYVQDTLRCRPAVFASAVEATSLTGSRAS